MINKRYSLIKKLGQGRSTVYLCSDAEIPNAVFAIKILPPDVSETEKENFMREFFILRKLDHPHIIKSLEIGTAVYISDDDDIKPGSIFITLEFFDANELLDSGFIRDETGLTKITAQVCSVLYYLHQSRYIYYDLKPENILVANINGEPFVKLIDLGLAEYSPDPDNYVIKGTAQYIAPELLKKQSHNHSADLYSLGMMLYRIIYNRFPFDTDNELEIYKEQIEKEFPFPSSEIYSESIINITKMLLEKEPSKRVGNALEILFSLNMLKENIKFTEFVPAKIIAGRSTEMEVLNSYLADKAGSEMVALKGFSGTGKTALLNYLNETRTDSVLIGDIKSKSGIELIKYTLNKILFSDSVFPVLDNRSREKIFELISVMDEDVRASFKSTVISMVSKCRFILLIDDFNLFDEFSAELFLEIIPVLQVNNIKIIISESSEHPFYSNKLHNVKDIFLGPFTDEQLNEFVDRSFNNSFPKNELRALIQSHSDLVPGSVISFIKDLIYFNIIKFSGTGVTIAGADDNLALLERSHSAFYELRLAALSGKETEIVEIISAFDQVIDVNTLALLCGISVDEAEKLIAGLQLNNILQHYTNIKSLVFTSESLKKYIYSSITDNKTVHLKIAEKLSRVLPSFNRRELARHFELAGKYEMCCQVLENELAEAEQHSAFSYMKTMLEHLINLPLNVSLMNTVKIKLSEVYYKLSDFNSSITTIESLEKAGLSTTAINKNKVIKAGALIGRGEFESGKIILEEILDQIEDQNEKNRLMVEIAYADFELKNYEAAERRCDTVLDSPGLSAELKGRCYNLKGMRRIYEFNDLNDALENFQKALQHYKNADLVRLAVSMENNIGNIYYLLGDYQRAEERWKLASQINQSIGNLDWEGNLLMNIGIFYADLQKPEQAIESYLKAENIFLSLGNHFSRGLLLINLGEVYLKICEYEKSVYTLNKAADIFSGIGNYEELAEALFMLSKLYFTIGAADKLNETVNSFESNLTIHKLPSKQNLNLRYLKAIMLMLNQDIISAKELKLICEEYKKLGEKNNYLDFKFLLIKSLVSENSYSVALEEINEQYFLDLCLQNSILDAEREYFLGKISQNYASDKIKPPLEHFEKAYKLIQDQSVTEITWNILLVIVENYIERGNFQKAKALTVYGRELINLIAEKIESPRLRAAYLKHPERFRAIKKFDSFYQA